MWSDATPARVRGREPQKRLCPGPLEASGLRWEHRSILPSSPPMTWLPALPVQLAAHSPSSSGQDVCSHCFPVNLGAHLSLETLAALRGAHGVHLWDRPALGDTGDRAGMSAPHFLGHRARGQCGAGQRLVSSVAVLTAHTSAVVPWPLPIRASVRRAQAPMARERGDRVAAAGEGQGGHRFSGNIPRGREQDGTSYRWRLEKAHSCACEKPQEELTGKPLQGN